VCITTSILITLWFNPTLEAEERPLWIHLVSFAGVILLLVLDAVDGKHARNTGQSSAVGHWLDHGFDAANITYNVINGFICTNISFSFPLAIPTLIFAQLQWLSVWWEEGTTGTIRFPLCADVEGSVFVCFFNLLTYFLGQEFFTDVFYVDPVFYIGWNLANVTCTMVMTQSVIFSLVSVWHVFHHITTKVATDKIGEVFQASLFTIFPFLVSGAVWSVLYYQYDISGTTANIVFILACGFTFAVMAIRLILSTLCHKYFSPIQPVVLPAVFLLANHLYGWADTVLCLQVVTVALALYYMWTMQRIYTQILAEPAKSA
jgi:phosphatidylglycerophosphate synthase